MTEENMVNVHRIWDGEMLSKGRTEKINDVFAPDYVSHDPTRPDLNGPEGAKGLVTMMRAAFPDLHFTVQDRFVSGEKIVVRWTGYGSHKGELIGIAPTNKRVEFQGVSIHRFEAGKIAESWENINYLGLLQQLGVVPSLG